MDLVFVAPDDPLAAGMVDFLEAAGIPCFGPNAAAAQIEASKVFSKDLMKKYGIPTAGYEVFADPAAALEYIKAQGKYPAVIKADGLAWARAWSSPRMRRRPRPPCTPLWRTRFSVKAALTWWWRSSSPARRFPCWLLLTARPCAPWCPLWTTSAPTTGTRAPTPAAWAPSAPTPSTPRRWPSSAWSGFSCPPWPP